LWLADEGAIRTVCQGFGRWSVRSAIDPTDVPVPLSDMPREARGSMEAAMAARPWAFAASTAIMPSLAPCYGQGGLQPSPVVLRLFLMHDGVGWHMMQGGMARVLAPGEHVTEALPPGAICKDVWVLRQENTDIRGPEAPPAVHLPILRGAGALPSRVADDFFWLGRYVERLEAQARLGRAGLLRRARGAPLPREVIELEVLFRCLCNAGLIPASEEGSLDGAIRRAVLPHGAVAAGLDQASRLIEALRDRLTVETHAAFAQAMRAAQQDMTEASGTGASRVDHPSIDALVHAMSGLQRLATTVAGVAAEGMVRNGGWLFLDLGRRIERAHIMALTLATVLDQPPARMDSTLRLALELCDSAITYRSRYMASLQPGPVLDLVLADTSNPRAVSFQFAQAVSLLNQADPEKDDLPEYAAGLLARMQAAVERVAASDTPAQACTALPPLLWAIAADTAALSDRITRRFFALLPTLQSVGMEVA